jgi:hypothetical protein
LNLSYTPERIAALAGDGAVQLDGRLHSILAAYWSIFLKKNS